MSTSLVAMKSGITQISQSTEAFARLESKSHDMSADLVAIKSGITQISQSTETLARLESKSHDMSASLVVLQSGITDISGSLNEIRTLMMDMISSAGNPPSPQEANLIASRAIQKPGALRELCDAARVRTRRSATEPEPSTYPGRGGFQDMVSSLLGNKFTCLCRTKWFPERRDFAWGPWAFQIVTATQGHLSWCPAAQRACAQQTRRVNLEYTGFRRILKAALRVSFELKSGAGGWSISPGFAYRPTVDPRTAPAFRILGLLGEAAASSPVLIVSHPYNEKCSSAWRILVSLALAKLSRLFRTGKASPLAVDSDNRSLAHYAAELVRA